MAEYKVHILVCTKSEGAEDKRHCGDKGGLSVWQSFRSLCAQYGLDREVIVSKTGCTGQHVRNGSTEATVIIYGPDPDMGGTWYKASPDDVEEIFREHIMKGHVVERCVNPSMCLKYTS